MGKKFDRPVPSPYDSWFVLLMVFAVVVSVLLEITGLERRLVSAFRPMLPNWFPTFNMLLAPFLAALSTVRLRLKIRVEIRLALLVLMLCCFSLYRLSFDRHPVATILIAILV